VPGRSLIGRLLAGYCTPSNAFGTPGSVRHIEHNRVHCGKGASSIPPLVDSDSGIHVCKCGLRPTIWPRGILVQRRKTRASPTYHKGTRNCHTGLPLFLDTRGAAILQRFRVPLRKQTTVLWSTESIKALLDDGLREPRTDGRPVLHQDLGDRVGRLFSTSGRTFQRIEGFRVWRIESGALAVCLLYLVRSCGQCG